VILIIIEAEAKVERIIIEKEVTIMIIEAIKERRRSNIKEDITNAENTKTNTDTRMRI
jgi:hypothetical protein